jgi:predicted metal-dependent phosphoesterase TrpH
MIPLVVLVALRGAALADVKTVTRAEDLPEKFSSTWAKGDFLVTEDGILALIGGTRRPMRSPMNYPAGNAMGSVLAFVPSGRGLMNDINLGAPVLLFDRKPEYLVYSSVTPEAPKEEGAGSRLVAVASYAGESNKRAAVRTVYEFFPDGRVEIVSTITNTGSGFLKDLNYSVYFSANHTYNFSPFSRDNHPNLNFRVYPKKGFFMAWINRNPPESEDAPGPGFVDPGKSYEVRYTLLADTDGRNLLERVYRLIGLEAFPAKASFKDFQGRLMEIVVKEVSTGSVFFRTFLGNRPASEFVLPEGAYWVRANFFPAIAESLLIVKPGETNSVLLEDPPKGKVRVKIRDAAGAYVPGKVTFIGLDPTKSPYFEPDNPIETGRAWETVKNACYPKEEGQTVSLPAGTYLVVASRGPEYGTDQKVIEVFKDSDQELLFKIDKALETTGLLSVDPHLHTQFSDGALGVPERLRSIVAEGLDLALATDHNYVTDYSAALSSLGLSSYLAVLSGEEVTPRDSYVHFNLYPLPFRDGELANGAFPAPLATGSLRTLLAAARRQFPEALLELNHPRSGRLGLFNNARLDPDSAAVAAENFDLSFDLIEVMNGPAFFDGNQKAVEDWFHLLNRGYVLAIAGSSDSHGAVGGEPGYSRVYVSYSGDKAAALDWKALAAALRAGRAFVSNGPLPELTVNGRYVPGDSFTNKGGKVDVVMRVRSAPWVRVSEVRLVVNGERKIIFPVKAADGTSIVFSQEVSFRLDRDAYLALEVLGMSSLYPVLQQVSRTGSYKNAALPYALTNPVFVDVDGNGRFDPPLAGRVGIRQTSPGAGNDVAGR